MNARAIAPARRWALPTVALDDLLASGLPCAGSVGPDLAWPSAEERPGPELSASELRIRVRELARDELDETLWLREQALGVVVDVVLAVRWVPSRGWAGWRRGPTTRELLGDGPDDRTLAGRLEAAIAGRAA